jgi:hypothetical protein
MISFSGSLKIFLLVPCCDMRKGFNGLYGLVSSGCGEDLQRKRSTSFVTGVIPSKSEKLDAAQLLNWNCS